MQIALPKETSADQSPQPQREEVCLSTNTGTTVRAIQFLPQNSPPPEEETNEAVQCALRPKQVKQCV